MTYVFHPEAREEYLDAVDFYETRRAGVGAAFTREVEFAIDQILEVRATLLKNFNVTRASGPCVRRSSENTADFSEANNFMHGPKARVTVAPTNAREC
jgi:hypothetical protein